MTTSFFQTGFRPFFLLAALGGTLGPPLWMLVFGGGMHLASPLPPLVWHIHEMLFAVIGAVIAGFLLTAVQSWTGRRTISGTPLAAMVLAWISGRILLLLPIAAPIAALPDLLWLGGTAVAIGIPIFQTRNQRNYAFPLIVMALAALHVITLMWPAAAIAGSRVVLDLICVVMVVITGRIIPMFTRNSLPSLVVGSWPTFDRLALGGTVLLTAGDLGFAVFGRSDLGDLASGGLCLATGSAILVRSIPWKGPSTLSQPLVAILHLGHTWIGVGMLLLGLSYLGAPLSTSTGVHALTVGAMATLCLGMMARVALGHTGRTLGIGKGMIAAFAAIAAAAGVRVATAGMNGGTLPLTLAAVLFGAAFLIYLIQYSAILFRPRVDGRPG